MIVRDWEFINVPLVSQNSLIVELPDVMVRAPPMLIEEKTWFPVTIMEQLPVHRIEFAIFPLNGPTKKTPPRLMSLPLSSPDD
jgi:hypothetical protein